ncbi:MAG: hypothetical protein ABI461_14270 [Polyangiaceae bacterium]
MQMRSFDKMFFVSLVMPLFGAGCGAAPAAAQPAPMLSHADAKRDHRGPDVGHVYRLDFVVASNNPTSATGGPGAGAFTMTLEEGHPGEIRSGSNVALAPNGTSRIDVGMMLKASYFMAGEDLLLDSSAELSSADEPGTIHRLVAKSNALVSPGKPALIASAEDQQGHTRYQLTVTATKMR